jgi:hypothetical protein
VILEQDQSGNNFLHLILPADRINFLNGSINGRNSFFNTSNFDKENLFSDFNDGLEGE